MHTNLAKHCFRVLDGGLRQNICDVRDAASVVDDLHPSFVEAHLPPHLCYACLYWIHHVSGSDNEAQFVGPIEGFLQKHFLHWLEALSLLRKVASAVRK